MAHPKTPAKKRKQPAKKAVAVPTAAEPPEDIFAKLTPFKPAHKSDESVAAQPRAHTLKLESSFSLMARTLRMLWDDWRLFGKFVLVYLALDLVFVHGLSNAGNLSQLKSGLDQTYTGAAAHFGNGVSAFFYLLGTSGSGTSAQAGTYQLLLVVIMSLALVWTFRERFSDRMPRLRDGFYQGMTPFVRVLLVLLMVCLQLIPMTLGVAVYSAVVVNHIVIHPWEQIPWAAAAIGLSALSLFFLSSSIIALDIVCLPDMPPRKALRSARDLVRYRRLAVLRRLAFAPLAVVAAGAVVLVPIILVAPALAPWLFLPLSSIGLVVMVGYLYTFYRSLL